MEREQIKVLRDEITAALSEVGRRHGMAIRAGDCSFGSGYCTFKVDCSRIESGVAVTRESSMYKQVQSRLGLPPLDFEFDSETNGRMRVVGYAVRNRTYPVIAVDSEGRQFKFPVRRIVAIWDRQKSVVSE